MQTPPALSPDGRWIAFFNAGNRTLWRIWAIPAEGGTAVQVCVTFDQSEMRGLVWSPDGKWIIFSSARRGSFTLWRVPSAGGRAEPLTTGAGEDYEAAISPHGWKLIYTNARTRWSLMLMDAASGAERELLTQREMIGSPSFSPGTIKGSHSSKPVDDSTHLFVAAADGGAPEQITHGTSQDNAFPAWSADGLALYFYRVRPAPSFRKQILTSGTSTEVAPWVYGSQNWAQVDPFGRMGVYTAVGPKGPHSTLLRDLATGKERPLALALTRLRWSPDGQSILGESRSRQAGESRVAICRIPENQCTELAPGLTPKWSADGTRIYFLRAAERVGRFHLWSCRARRFGTTENRHTGPLPGGRNSFRCFA